MSSQGEYNDLLAQIKALRACCLDNRKDIDKNKKALAALLNNTAFRFINQRKSEENNDTEDLCLWK